MSNHGRVTFQWLILLAAVLGVVAMAACGGTWIDDEKNFDRIFDFPKPSDVRVVHSFYWKSPHWTTEYRYYIQLEPSANFLGRLTDTSLMNPAAPNEVGTDSCLTDKPGWFLPKDMNTYQAWVSKTGLGYRVFRDKTDGSLFVCDERL